MMPQQPEQPLDYAPGHDPFVTDPFYRQSITEEEVIGPLAPVKDDSDEQDQKANQRGQYPALKRRPKRPFRKSAKPLSNSTHPADSLKVDPNLAVRILKFLAPLNDPWRLIIGFAVLFLSVNTVASRGWFTVIGLDPHASAASVTEIRVEQLDGQIENTVKAHCLASTEESKTYYWSKLKDLKGKYEKATAEKWEPPKCEELGVKRVRVGEP